VSSPFSVAGWTFPAFLLAAVQVNRPLAWYPRLAAAR